MQKELEILLSKLPSEISDCIRQSEAYKMGSGINEIRIRADRHLSLTYRGKNIILPYLVPVDLLNECVMRFCKREELLKFIQKQEFQKPTNKNQ